MSAPVIIGTRPAAPKGAATAARLIDRHVQANFYPTPPEATRALLSVETFDGLIWEPACGQDSPPFSKGLFGSPMRD
jgi:hypothetical protein